MEYQLRGLSILPFCKTKRVNADEIILVFLTLITFQSLVSNPMAKTEEGDKSEEKGKLTEEQPQVLADRGRVRSKEDEEALDKKIAEIRKKNQLIEQRKEVKVRWIL